MEHTVRHFRNEQFMPFLQVRDRYVTWEAAGRKRAEERARDHVRELISSHTPEPLPEDAVRELEAVYSSTRREAGLE